MMAKPVGFTKIGIIHSHILFTLYTVFLIYFMSYTVVLGNEKINATKTSLKQNKKTTVIVENSTHEVQNFTNTEIASINQYNKTRDISSDNTGMYYGGTEHFIDRDFTGSTGAYAKGTDRSVPTKMENTETPLLAVNTGGDERYDVN